ADAVPYRAQLNSFVVRTAAGDFIQTFRLAGVSFRSADDAQLNSMHERLNILWRNIASLNLALWTHIVRRSHPGLVRQALGGGFADALHAKYQERVGLETLMVNELYLTTVYRPTIGLATGLAAKAFRLGRRAAVQEQSIDA